MSAAAGAIGKVAGAAAASITLGAPGAAGDTTAAVAGASTLGVIGEGRGAQPSASKSAEST